MDAIQYRSVRKGSLLSSPKHFIFRLRYTKLPLNPYTPPKLPLQNPTLKKFRRRNLQYQDGGEDTQKGGTGEHESGGSTRVGSTAGAGSAVGCTVGSTVDEVGGAVSRGRVGAGAGGSSGRRARATGSSSGARSTGRGSEEVVGNAALKTSGVGGSVRSSTVALGASGNTVVGGIRIRSIGGRNASASC